MPLTSHLRRARTPALVTGLLAASVVGVVVPSASALDISRLPLDTMAASIDQAAPATARTEDKGRAQPLLPRVRLTAKPDPWVLPVVGYHLTGRFGQVSGLWSSTHTGLDFAAPEGAEIRSISPGVVLSTAYDGAFGNKTVVRLDDGTVLWYCHQSEFGVDPGQRVKPGDLIGYIGSTGNTTGPHLHLEVHPHGGDAIDPEVWLPEHHLHP